MKTKQEIETKLKEIKADKRLGYPTATIVENAVLALTQLSLEKQRNTLEWVLN